eukprot:GFYU01029667.1.p1 GENE.GFYU01029667.1~~GFYU01029667.1.p1  ORF type:complete len:255 (+),score=65.66 GFYU01029667.1:31-765(+)
MPDIIVHYEVESTSGLTVVAKFTSEGTNTQQFVVDTKGIDEKPTGNVIHLAETLSFTFNPDGKLVQIQSLDRHVGGKISSFLHQGPHSQRLCYLRECRSLNVHAHKDVMDVLESADRAGKCQSFDFHHDLTGKRGSLPLLKAVSLNRDLTHLDLSGCGLRNAAIMVLVDVMKSHVALRQLNLSYNHISFDAGHALKRFAAGNPQILEINLDITEVPYSMRADVEAMLVRNRNRVRNALPDASKK